MKNLKQYSYLKTILVAVILIFSFSSVSFAEGEFSIIQFVKNLFKKIEFKTSVKYDFDDNIFLSDADESSDIINTLTQNVSLKIPEDPFYLEMDYTGNLSYYIQEGDSINNQTAKLILSYRPFDYISFGIADYFTKMFSKSITTSFGDRLLSRGYLQNIPVVDVKVEPIEKLTLDASYRNYYLDAVSTNDDYIDRGDDIFNFGVNYEIWPDLISSAGYEFQDVDFRNYFIKDAESHRAALGLTKKFDVVNLTAEVGREYKDAENLHDGEETDCSLKVDTTYSVYNIVNFTYTFNRAVPSARTEYFQYFTNSAEVALRHLINPKTTVLTNIKYEKQVFEDTDAIQGQLQEDRDTKIITFGTTLRRSLNDWLDFDLGYSLTRRSTDFVGESYTNNKITVGITGSY